MSQLKLEDKKLHEAINRAMENDDFYDTILETALTQKCRQLQARNKELRNFISKLCSTSITFQPDTELAWETITVYEIIGSDKKLELAYKALEENFV